MGTLYFYIERMESGAALCEREDGSVLCISCEKLPAGAREGAVLREEGGVYMLDPQAEDRRRAALFSLQEDVFAPPGSGAEGGSAV